MKKYLIAAAMLALPFMANAGHKVTICHATESNTNPWVRVVVDEHATAGHFDNNGTPLAGHEDDVLLQGDVSCPATTPPVDVCPDIAGVQTDRAQCPAPVDKCPDINGIQTDPADCPLTQPVDDVCPNMPGNQTTTDDCPDDDNGAPGGAAGGGSSGGASGGGSHHGSSNNNPPSFVIPQIPQFPQVPAGQPIDHILLSQTPNTGYGWTEFFQDEWIKFVIALSVAFAGAWGVSKYVPLNRRTKFHSI